MKNISQAEIDLAKKEHDKKWAKRKKTICRSFYFLLAVGNIAITVFLAILNVDAQLGHYILSGFSGLSAFYFTYKLIGE
jgi:hypothetical protein